MSINKNTYIGAYLEVTDNQEYGFDVDEIDQYLRVHDQCTVKQGDKLFWLPNVSSDAEIISDSETSGNRQQAMEITENDIENCIDNFKLEFPKEIIALKNFYGGGEVKFGFVIGFN